MVLEAFRAATREGEQEEFVLQVRKKQLSVPESLFREAVEQLLTCEELL